MRTRLKMAATAVVAAMLAVGAFEVVQQVFRAGDVWAVVVALLLASLFGCAMAATHTP